MSDIKNVLGQHGQLGNFGNTCFGHFLRFDENALFLSHLVHILLVMDITFDNAGDLEIWFGIG